MAVPFLFVWFAVIIANELSDNPYICSRMPSPMNIGNVSSVCRVVRLVLLFSGALDHNSGFVKVYLVCRRFLAFAVAVHAEFPFRSFFIYSRFTTFY